MRKGIDFIQENTFRMKIIEAKLRFDAGCSIYVNENMYTEIDGLNNHF